MRYDRTAVRWSLVLILGATLQAFAAIRPDGAATNAPPAPNASQAPEAAPASEQASAASTSVVSSMPLPIAPTPLDAQPGGGLHWIPLVFALIGLLVGIVVLLKFSSRNK